MSEGLVPINAKPDWSKANYNNPWHTGTPTELGDYVVAFKCIHECKQKGVIEYHTWHISEEEFGYKVIKGQPSDDVWKAVAYQKIEPYKED